MLFADLLKIIADGTWLFIRFKGARDTVMRAKLIRDDRDNDFHDFRRLTVVNIDANTIQDHVWFDVVLANDIN